MFLFEIIDIGRFHNLKIFGKDWHRKHTDHKADNTNRLAQRKNDFK